MMETSKTVHKLDLSPEDLQFIKDNGGVVDTKISYKKRRCNKSPRLIDEVIRRNSKVYYSIKAFADAIKGYKKRLKYATEQAVMMSKQYGNVKIEVEWPKSSNKPVYVFGEHRRSSVAQVLRILQSAAATLPKWGANEIPLAA